MNSNERRCITAEITRLILTALPRNTHFVRAPFFDEVLEVELELELKDADFALGFDDFSVRLLHPVALQLAGRLHGVRSVAMVKLPTHRDVLIAQRFSDVDSGLIVEFDRSHRQGRIRSVFRVYCSRREPDAIDRPFESYI